MSEHPFPGDMRASEGNLNALGNVGFFLSLPKEATGGIVVDLRDKSFEIGALQVGRMILPTSCNKLIQRSVSDSLSKQVSHSLRGYVEDPHRWDSSMLDTALIRELASHGRKRFQKPMSRERSSHSLGIGGHVVTLLNDL